MDENRRKCFKCGCSPADHNVKLFRFPKPGVRNLIRCMLWAKYIFPEGQYSSIQNQTKLYNDHRMLCEKHFKDADFKDITKAKLLQTAVPCDDPEMDGHTGKGNALGNPPYKKGTRDKGLWNTSDETSRGEGLTHTQEGEPEGMGQNRDRISDNVDLENTDSDGTRSFILGLKDVQKRKERRRMEIAKSSQSRRRRYHSTSSESASESPSPKKKRRLQGKESDSRLKDKFLTVLEKCKGSGKPKMYFNSNVIPKFDPLSKEQTISTWLTKIEECAEIYGWEEKEIVHYSLPKLTGVAKTWYQGLTSKLHTWSEWKKKLIESFPCREDYAELLTEMLAKKARYGESLEHYYYAKVNLLNRCKIYGRQAVDCLLHGIDDRAVKFGAQAVQFNEPEQLLKYFRNVKSGPSREVQDSRKLNERSFGSNPNRPAPYKPGTNINYNIKCFNCNEIGHPSFKCEKPLIKCTNCDRLGHLITNCLRNKRTTNEPDKNKTPGNDQTEKQVSEVTAEGSGLSKYVLGIEL